MLDVLMPLRENFPEDILPELYIGRCRRYLRDDISECKDEAFDDQSFHKD